MSSDIFTTFGVNSWLGSFFSTLSTMRRAIEEKPSDTSYLDQTWRGKVWAMLGSICSLKLFRQPTLPLKVALGITLLMPLTYSWHLLGILDIKPGALAFTSSTSKFQLELESDSNSTSSRSSNTTQSHMSDGLRMVVFGGGDIGTSALSASLWSDQAYAWTEIMCRKVIVI